MVLKWTPEEASPLHDRIFSAAESLILRTTRHFLTGYPSTKGQETS